MGKVSYDVRIVSNVSNTDQDALKLLGREIVAGIALGTDGNMNVEDIEVHSIEATELITRKTNCMPEEVPGL